MSWIYVYCTCLKSYAQKRSHCLSSHIIIIAAVLNCFQLHDNGRQTTELKKTPGTQWNGSLEQKMTGYSRKLQGGPKMAP